MKDKKGFTLIELVGVIVLIAIIMFLAYPNFANLSKKAKLKYDMSTKVLIKSAASMYVNNNKEEIDTKLNSSTKVCIPIGRLVAYEYLDSELTKSDGTQMQYNSCVNVSKETQDGKTKYKYDVDNNDTIASTIDYMPPVLKLKTKPGFNNVECKRIMTVASINDFISRCEVAATDDKDGSVEVKGPIQKIGRDNKRVFLEYNATDLSGNKAVPLKIELILP